MLLNNIDSNEPESFKVGKKSSESIKLCIFYSKAENIVEKKLIAVIENEQEIEYLDLFY